AEGLICRNIPRMLISGAVGLGVGFAAALVLTIPVNCIYGMIQDAAFSGYREGERPHGMGLFVQIVNRSIAWAVIAIPAGLGQGIALREKKVIWNGLLGAVLGGL